MTAETSQSTKKAMPKTESVPILLGAALIVAAVLVIACSVLFADSDASMRRKVLGKWQLCPKDEACIETIFTGDGEMALRGLAGGFVMDLRGTWSIHNGDMTAQLNGGGDWLSSAAVGLSQVFGTDSTKPMHGPVRFEGNSVMYLGHEKFVRLGNASQ